MSGHNEIYRHIRRAGNTGGQPVLRHMGQAQAADLTRGQTLHRAPLNLHLPGGNGPHTGDGFQKLTLSVALHSGNAQDLVSVHLKGDAPYGR